MMNSTHVSVGARLPVRTRFGYALGSLSTGAFGTVPGLLLLPYLTDTLGVSASVAGLLVLLPKAWDVLFNPVAGRISDRTTGRLGARRPYLIAGGIALAICFAGLFAGPDTGSATVDALYVAGMFLLCATAFAFFQVPYNALPAELTDDPGERTRLTAWRIAVLAIAILVSGAGAPAPLTRIAMASTEMRHAVSLVRSVGSSTSSTGSALYGTWKNANAVAHNRNMPAT